LALEVVAEFANDVARHLLQFFFVGVHVGIRLALQLELSGIEFLDLTRSKLLLDEFLNELLVEVLCRLGADLHLPTSRRLGMADVLGDAVHVREERTVLLLEFHDIGDLNPPMLHHMRYSILPISKRVLVLKFSFSFTPSTM
jgi:hypothetical protein